MPKHPEAARQKQGEAPADAWNWGEPNHPKATGRRAPRLR